MTLNKKVPKSFLTQVMDGKHVFRAHCEAIRRVLQSSCRHAVDYATSSQSAPDDRFMSAKRCFLSAKSVYRDVLELSRAYEVTVVDFNKQRSLLSAYLTAHAKNGEVFDFFFGDSVTLLKQKNFSSQVAGREREWRACVVCSIRGNTDMPSGHSSVLGISRWFSCVAGQPTNQLSFSGSRGQGDFRALDWISIVPCQVKQLDLGILWRSLDGAGF